MKKGAAKILTPFLEVEASSKAAQCNLTPTLWEKDRSYIPELFLFLHEQRTLEAASVQREHDGG